ncbi:MAG: sugar phosphate isomerase/epimerase family protein [Planctomycetota bacterium]
MISADRIGVALWSIGIGATEAEFAKVLDDALKTGVKGVQPWCVDEPAWKTVCWLDPDRCSTSALRSKARKMIESRGLKISGLCSQLAGPTHLGGIGEAHADMEADVVKTERSLELAADLGVQVVTTHPGPIPADAADPVYALMLKNLGRIAKTAERTRTQFCIETGQESAETLRGFLEKIGSPGLKVNFDPANMVRWGTVPAVKTLAKYIVHTHAKDINEKTGKATLGTGAVPWPAYLKALDEVGYTGWFAIEDESKNEKLASISTGREFLLNAKY